MYIVFTRMLCESNRRRLRSLLLCLCEVFRAPVNPLKLILHRRSGPRSVLDLKRKEKENIIRSSLLTELM